MKEFINLLERKIEGCDSLGGLEREKAVYQSVLKDYKKQLNLCGVSHSTTPNYLDDKYEVKWLINNTYQVEQNGNCVYQGSESDCNEWLKCQLGYCG